MSEYPFSYTSSKKLKSSSRALQQKSAIQSTNVNIIDPKEYGHILKGEKIFIEMYFQGIVYESPYNKYISIFGGTLYKRLHPNVTIFITNADDKEFGGIKQRTRRSCPDCKIVNILWLEQCFQKKMKIPFEGFLVEQDIQEINARKQKQQEQNFHYDDKQFQQFVSNICQDIQEDYKQFLKPRKNEFFEYPQKNAHTPESNLMKAMQFDLGPRINKKKNTNVPLDRNRRRNESKARRNTLNSSKSKHKKQKQQKEQVIEIADTAIEEKSEEYVFKRVDINQILSRYIDNQSKSSEKSTSTISQKNKNNSRRKRMSPDQEEPKNVIDLEKQTENIGKSIVKSSRPSAATLKEPIRKPLQIQSKYKSAHEKFNKQSPKQQIEQIVSFIKNQLKNSIIAVSDSTIMTRKVEDIKSVRIVTKEIIVKHIKFNIYWDFLKGSPPQHKAYFLFNPNRIPDRPLSLALKLKYPNSAIVSFRLLDQVLQQNMKIRSNYQYLSEDIPSIRLKYLKQLTLNMDKDAIQGKKITFIKPSLPLQIIKIIVKQLNGQYLNESAYMMGEEPDIMVTYKLCISDKRTKYMTQQEFWKMVFPI